MSEIASRRRTRTTVLIAALAALAVLVALGGWLWAARDSGSDTADLGSRTVNAGEVEVTMTALALDDRGARFRLAFDTHTVELDTDLPSAATLRIDGRPADSSGTWEGDRPDGHHREGVLSFATAIPAGSSIELRITGLPKPVVATWTAP